MVFRFEGRRKIREKKGETYCGMLRRSSGARQGNGALTYQLESHC